MQRQARQPSQTSENCRCVGSSVCESVRRRLAEDAFRADVRATDALPMRAGQSGRTKAYYVNDSTRTPSILAGRTSAILRQRCYANAFHFSSPPAVAASSTQNVVFTSSALQRHLQSKRNVKRRIADGTRTARRWKGQRNACQDMQLREFAKRKPKQQGHGQQRRRGEPITSRNLRRGNGSGEDQGSQQRPTEATTRTAPLHPLRFAWAKNHSALQSHSASGR